MTSSSLYVLLSAIAASLSNLVLAKAQKKFSSFNGYLISYFFTGFLISISLHRLAFEQFSLHWPMAAIGAITGALIILLIVVIGRALQKGPSGLTFAFQNSGAVLAPLVLALIFSSDFGFTLTTGNVVGMGLVLIGLFWATQGPQNQRLPRDWLVYAFLALVIQGFILVVYQWRCLLMETNLPQHSLIFLTCSKDAEQWFMPAPFASSTIIQMVRLVVSERRAPTANEGIWGVLGGLANGASTLFLLQATESATAWEKMMLFPAFTVVIIILCNLYGKWLYREKILWRANAIAALGIFIGAMF